MERGWRCDEISNEAKVVLEGRRQKLEYPSVLIFLGRAKTIRELAPTPDRPSPPARADVVSQICLIYLQSNTLHGGCLIICALGGLLLPAAILIATFTGYRFRPRDRHDTPKGRFYSLHKRRDNGYIVASLLCTTAEPVQAFHD